MFRKNLYNSFFISLIIIIYRIIPEKNLNSGAVRRKFDNIFKVNAVHLCMVNSERIKDM